MKIKLYILFLITSIVFQAIEHKAYGAIFTKTTTKNCCKSDTKNPICCSKKNDLSNKNDCEGNCNTGGCNCVNPLSFQITTPINNSFITKKSYFEYKSNWYFTETVPDKVFISIWLPPKIS